jgi:hypothetical protein
MEITDFAQSHRFTRSVYTFNLIINGKEVEGDYEWEESTLSTEDDIVIENYEQFTEEEYEAVCDYVRAKFSDM